MASEGRPAASTRFSGELQQPLLGPGVLRAAKIIQIAAMTGAVGYAVFFHDFGTQDHCFMPIRRAVSDARNRFFTPTEEEKEALARLRQQASGQPPRDA